MGECLLNSVAKGSAAMAYGANGAYDYHEPAPTVAAHRAAFEAAVTNAPASLAMAGAVI